MHALLPGTSELYFSGSLNLCLSSARPDSTAMRHGPGTRHGQSSSFMLALVGSFVLTFQVYLAVTSGYLPNCAQIFSVIGPSRPGVDIHDGQYIKQFTALPSSSSLGGNLKSGIGGGQEQVPPAFKKLQNVAQGWGGDTASPLRMVEEVGVTEHRHGASGYGNRGVIGVYSIFIGVYKHFLDGFIDNVNEKFVPTYRKVFFIVTDDEDICERLRHRKDFQCVIKQKVGWPYESLNRWAYFKEFDTSGTDYIWFFNSNTQYVQAVGEEVLAPHTAVLHDIYVDKPYWVLPVEKRPISHAFVPERPYYKYYGARLYGATTHNFIRMCDVLERNTRRDEMSHFIALWHDESHYNYYVNVVLDTKVKELGPEFHVPEEMGPDYLPQRKAIYLDKKKHIPNLNTTKSLDWRDWIGGTVRHDSVHFKVPDFRPHLYRHLNHEVSKDMDEEEMIKDYVENFEIREYYHETGIFAATFDAARYARYYKLPSEIVAKAHYYRTGYKQDRYYFLQQGAEDYGLTMPTLIKADNPDPQGPYTGKEWGRIGLE